MNDAKYIGLDVHQATISAAVRDSDGKLVLEAILETKAETMLQFVHGLRGSLHVTFEEGTSADWLYTLLKPHVTEVLVCDPRKNALLKVGNKGDRIDARKLSDLLRANLLRAVFHDDTGLRTLREMARSYLTITKDVTRVMRRLKALYRARLFRVEVNKFTRRAIVPNGWKITEASVRRRAELYYQQLDALRVLHQQAKKELLAEGRKHTVKLLRQIPSIGPIRSSVGCNSTNTASVPHQEATVELQWSSVGDTQQRGISHEGGQLKRSKKVFAVRGLNENHNHDVKNIFKGAAIRAMTVEGPFQKFYEALVAKGMKPAMARLTLARKIAAITLIVWKKGAHFDAEHLKRQAA